MAPGVVLFEARGEGEKFEMEVRGGGGKGLKDVGGIGFAPRLRIDGVLARGVEMGDVNGAGDEGRECDCAGRVEVESERCAPCNGVGDCTGVSARILPHTSSSHPLPPPSDVVGGAFGLGALPPTRLSKSTPPPPPRDRFGVDPLLPPERSSTR